MVKKLSNSSHNMLLLVLLSQTSGQVSLRQETVHARAVIADLANHNKEIRSMNMDIQKLEPQVGPKIGETPIIIPSFR